VKEHETAVATLAELKATVLYEIAQELLKARDDSWVHKDGKKTHQFTPGYKKKKAALKKLYGR
jgi:hypothetical protein